MVLMEVGKGEESGDSDEVLLFGGESMVDDDDDGDAESCTGGDDGEEMKKGWKRKRDQVDDEDDELRIWFSFEEEKVAEKEEFSVHKIEDNKLFWETCLAVGY
ncbi:hypothetical protein IHE45_07G042800 [Dioscorea alata]|uniref:Uncharacterized protein n=1 Tax=Dioscorea alata TaxID=55571 RepID=A0ACB7VR47_DIOAL|nr:hypothetical protein IHE45_07G042800 [Dioscorea alata]